MSGALSYFFGRDIAMAFVAPEHAAHGTRVQVLILNDLRDAEVVADSMYDPTNARSRM